MFRRKNDRKKRVQIEIKNKDKLEEEKSPNIHLWASVYGSRTCNKGRSIPGRVRVQKAAQTIKLFIELVAGDMTGRWHEAADHRPQNNESIQVLTN